MQYLGPHSAKNCINTQEDIGPALENIEPCAMYGQTPSPMQSLAQFAGLGLCSSQTRPNFRAVRVTQNGSQE